MEGEGRKWKWNLDDIFFFAFIWHKKKTNIIYIFEYIYIYFFIYFFLIFFSSFKKKKKKEKKNFFFFKKIT